MSGSTNVNYNYYSNYDGMRNDLSTDNTFSKTFFISGFYSVVACANAIGTGTQVICTKPKTFDIFLRLDN